MVQWYNITNYNMPKDYFIVYKDYRNEIMKTKKGWNVNNKYIQY